MKYISMLLVLALIVSSALAEDRAVSGSGGGNPMGSAKASACHQAKRDAEKKAHHDEEVAVYSECDCTKDEQANKEAPWSCTVDAVLQKRNSK